MERWKFPSTPQRARTGDLILEFAGAPTNSMEELVRKIQEKKAEEKVEISILQNSKGWVVEAVLERTP